MRASPNRITGDLMAEQAAGMRQKGPTAPVAEQAVRKRPKNYTRAIIESLAAPGIAPAHESGPDIGDE